MEKLLIILRNNPKKKIAWTGKVANKKFKNMKVLCSVLQIYIPAVRKRDQDRMSPIIWKIFKR